MFGAATTRRDGPLGRAPRSAADVPLLRRGSPVITSTVPPAAASRALTAYRPSAVFTTSYAGRGEPSAFVRPASNPLSPAPVQL